MKLKNPFKFVQDPKRNLKELRLFGKPLEKVEGILLVPLIYIFIVLPILIIFGPALLIGKIYSYLFPYNPTKVEFLEALEGATSPSYWEDFTPPKPVDPELESYRQKIIDFESSIITSEDDSDYADEANWDKMREFIKSLIVEIKENNEPVSVHAAQALVATAPHSGKATVKTNTFCTRIAYSYPLLSLINLNCGEITFFDDHFIGRRLTIFGFRTIKLYYKDIKYTYFRHSRIKAGLFIITTDLHDFYIRRVMMKKDDYIKAIDKLIELMPKDVETKDAEDLITEYKNNKYLF